MPITRDQVEKINKLVSVNIKQLWKEESFIKSITDKVSKIIMETLNEKLSEYEREILEVKKEVKKLDDDIHEIELNSTVKLDKFESELEKIKNANKIIEKQYEALDQHSRRNNLRIFNLKEENNENTEQRIIRIFKEKMKIEIRPEDIEGCHRVGKRESTEPRGILLKLRTYIKKEEIFNAKKFMKGTGTVIREDLTQTRVKLLREAIQKFSIVNTWTRNGKILAKVNGKIIIIHSADHLNNLSL
ncbi:unnamed protein product [Phaedon cochleariae]|uniref:Uncharacterized protein n=1 Tax=Phaedon cochleariae TaxID=80249 RepID=A0A9N9SLT5_PHACE|nr:unnamed protein product [Phaedon cochleariae]